MNQPLPLKNLQVDDLVLHISDLVHQKELLQKVDRLSNNNIDFGDIIETYSLLVEEIKRLQKALKDNRLECLCPGVKEVVFEEEEEESASSSKYNIEHVIKDSKGLLRAVASDDLDLEKNPGVKNAFKVLYQWHKHYSNSKEYENEESLCGNSLEIEDSKVFSKLIKDRAKRGD